MLSSLILFVTLSINAAPVVQACETYAPNVEGIRVTVCGGEVTKRCDASGNCLFSASTYASSN